MGNYVATYLGTAAVQGPTAKPDDDAQSATYSPDGSFVGWVTPLAEGAASLRIGGVSADRIVLTADVAGNPQIQAFNLGIVDARLTAQQLPTSPPTAGWYSNANLHVAGNISTAGAFQASPSLTASSTSTSPYVRVWDTGSSWLDLIITDGTNKAHFRDHSGATILSFGLGSTNTIGFFGASGVTKPEVTGSHGSNAALQSLLTALENLGLITDSSTA